MFGQDDNQQTNDGAVDSTAQASVPGTAPSFSNPTFTPTDIDTVVADQDTEQTGQPEQPKQLEEAESNEDTSTPVPSPAASSATSDLADIKKDALSQLSPLVSHLDQSPIEKFRTLMMMIQSTDDQTLLKEAFEAAQKVEDEGEKAKALLAIINEIDYFSQDSKES